MTGPELPGRPLVPGGAGGNTPRGPASLPQAPTNVRSLVLVLACGVSFLLYLHRYTWGFVKPDVQEEFGWEPVMLGWLDGLFVASYGAAQVPSGILCDWFGAHALLGSSVILWSLSLAGVALATGIISMAVARLVFGVAQAGCYPVLNKVSKNWFPAGARTTAQGWIATFFGRAGGAVSVVLFGTVLMGWLAMRWQDAIYVFAALGVACGVLFLLLFRNTPREHPWANAAEADLIVAGDPEAARATHSRLRWKALVGSGSMWFLFLRAFASNMADVLFVYWFPMYLLDELRVSKEEAGWMAALPFVGGASGGVVSGRLQSYLIRRTGNRRWARAGVALAGKVLAAGFIFLLPGLAAGNAAAVACAFLVARFFCDWEQPAEWGTVSDVAGRNAATVFACVNTLGAVGGFVASPLTGFALVYFSGSDKITAAGWNALFVITGIEYLVSAACWLFIDCGKPLESSPSGSTP